MAPSSFSSFSYDFSYDVFISFRGADTRFSFTGNLYKALSDKGIRTFIDEKELQRGDEIKPSLLKNIEDSRIAIIVFSKDYASSSYCLDELVHIIHYFKAKGRLILPVFYGVEPSQVRHQNDSYHEALANHEERFKNNKQNMERKDEYEYEFITKIVTEISNKINRVLLEVADHPVVGLESRLLQVKSLLDVDCDNVVCMIGIYGSGGLGKTTLTRAVYNLFADQFEGLCFLHNVRENSIKYGLEYLQEQLLFKSIGLKINLGHVSEGIPIIKQRLRQKKVLLILDDVDKLKQLRALVGEPGWLGPGSRVIITTRDKHLLSCHGIKRIYELEFLNQEEALELFRWMTLKSNKVDPRYNYILYRAVKYASGLPLALEVVGSNLFGKCIAEWKSTLDKYERFPHEDIQKILKISFDGLDEEQQSVFLDIACCFKGCTLAEVDEILHGHYGHCIKSNLRVLVDKSLIKISFTNEVTLHDLIEDMGKEIVRQESPNEPGERSRLWCHDDITHVLQENTGTNWNGKAFKKMTKLKTLIIENGHFSKGPKYLPSSLRVLKWKGCTSESLSSNILNTASEIISFFNCKLENMKVLTFDHCQYLTHIPTVSGLPNLKKLSFEKCHNLITIDSSIGYLNKLQILNAKECIKLESFPPLRLASLKELELSDCNRLKSFPELLCKMKNIKKIFLCGTSIRELTFSFQNLSELRYLSIYQPNVRFSSDIFTMPLSSNVESVRLENNNLSDECLPIVLKWFVNVKELILSDNCTFKILPECLNECHLMRILKLDGCKSLEEIRGIPPNLKEISAMGCYSLTSSSRRMLLSKELHEAGGTKIFLPTGTEGIPDWFEHQIRGKTISFWFRKKIPSILSIILLRDNEYTLRVNLFVNGYEYTLSDYFLYGSPLFFHRQSEHTFLFDLKLEEKIKRCKSIHGNLLYELEEALLKNEWIHVELNLKSFGKFNLSTQIGIHVFKKKRSMEEDVKFEEQTQMGIQVFKKKRTMANISQLISLIRCTFPQSKECLCEFFCKPLEVDEDTSNDNLVDKPLECCGNYPCPAAVTGSVSVDVIRQRWQSFGVKELDLRNNNTFNAYGSMKRLQVGFIAFQKHFFRVQCRVLPMGHGKR
nr:nodulation protein [Melilotus officinalis]